MPQTATLESLGLTWATNQVQFSGHRCHAIIGNRTQAYNQADKSVGVFLRSRSSKIHEWKKDRKNKGLPSTSEEVFGQMCHTHQLWSHHAFRKGVGLIGSPPDSGSLCAVSQGRRGDTGRSSATRAYNWWSSSWHSSFQLAPSRPIVSFTAESGILQTILNSLAFNPANAADGCGGYVLACARGAL